MHHRSSSKESGHLEQLDEQLRRHGRCRRRGHVRCRADGGGGCRLVREGRQARTNKEPVISIRLRRTALTFVTPKQLFCNLFLLDHISIFISPIFSPSSADLLTEKVRTMQNTMYGSISNGHSIGGQASSSYPPSATSVSGDEGDVHAQSVNGVEEATAGPSTETNGYGQ